MLVNNKETTKLCDKSGVYEVDCSACGALYNIGQSGRLIRERIKKHKKAILNNNKNTGFAEHIFNTSNYKLLHNTYKAVQVASKSLLEAVGDTYESQWSGHDSLYVQTQSIDSLWQDFYHKLTDQVCIPLNTYQSQFPEMRKKIDKRGRKLVDYDSQRHSFQALQLNMAKKRDEGKIAKGREQLEEAKRTYEVLNSELHDELPALYDSRILFLVTNLQTLFNAEQVFHSETSKIFGALENIVDKLATESQRSSYTIKKTNGTSLPRTNVNTTSHINNISPIKNSSSIPDDIPFSPSANEPPEPTKNAKQATATRLSTDSTPPSTPTTPVTQPDTPVTPTSATFPQPSIATPVATTPTSQSTPVVATSTKPTTPDIPVSSEIPVSASNDDIVIPTNSNIVARNEVVNGAASDPPTSKTQDSGDDTSHHAYSNANPTSKPVEELYDIPVGATTDNLPAGVLYRVKATYKYNREDVDELSFDVGEAIQVIEYDDPEEQEEGWLMGIKEATGEKGMFPANFTRPL
ncbi:amphiphysin [Holotrichia oblita]|uniref:Amphiphysin n=1 Tax=Holotrichia oblita TaxID=644536 RepID=A0ACB9SYX3_HOLOL|nr:amphiphysin [Holotrichia oblita]